MDRSEIRFKIKALSWILTFTQANLNCLRDNDLYPLSLLFSTPIGRITDFNKLTWNEKHFTPLKEYKKESIIPIYIKLGNKKITTKEFLRAGFVQKEFKLFLSKILDERIQYITLPEVSLSLQKFQNKIYKRSEMNDEKEFIKIGDLRPISIGPRLFHIQHFVKKEDSPLNVGVALINFAALLDGLPENIIKKCDECKRFFIDNSKRKRRFCNLTCGWKYHSREKREELKKDPKKYEKYKQKQADIMWKKYREKRRSEGYKIIQRKKTKYSH